MAGRGAAAARHRPLHRLRRADPRSEDRRSGADRTRWRATASISARSARRRPMRAGSSGSRAQGVTDADARAHPCADRARHRRGLAARDRGRDHGRDHRAAASSRPEQGGMKFGAVPVAAGRGRRRGAFDPPGRPGAEEGHADRHAGDRGARRRPASPRSSWRGSSRATCRRTRPRPRSRRRSRARACASIAPSPAAPICLPRPPACWSSTRTPSIASTRSTRRSPLRRLPAYKPVVAGEMIATVKIIPFAVTGGARRRAHGRACGAPAGAGRALPHPQGRRRLDPAAGARRQGHREDVEGDRRAPGARRRQHRRRATRAARAAAAGARRSRRCCGEGAELVIVFGASAIADRRDVIPAAIEAVGRTHRAFRHAGRSRQSAVDRRCRAASRCSARRAARARPRRTASTGC